MSEELHVNTRWMIRRDMDEILDIEMRSFAEPWCEDDYIRTLRQKNCIGIAADHGEQVVGTMIYELHRDKLGLLRFAVDPHFRRCRVGDQMVSKLVGKLSPGRRTQLTIDVRESNLTGQQFFRTVGFRATKIIDDVFEGEDAYRFVYDLNQPEPYTPANRITRLYAR